SNWIGLTATPQINLQPNGETVIVFIYNGSTVFQEMELVAWPAGIVLSVGSQTVGTNNIVFANSNGISFGMSGSSQITASGSSATLSAGVSNVGNTAGGGGVATGSNL